MNPHATTMEQVSGVVSITGGAEWQLRDSNSRPCGFDPPPAQKTTACSATNETIVKTAGLNSVRLGDCHVFPFSHVSFLPLAGSSPAGPNGYVPE